MHILTSPDINTYCEQFTTPESKALHELSRQTHLRTDLPVMLSGHLQGRVLSMISHMIRPKHILELGTFTGYSAICLAEGLADDGRLTTIDCNEELGELSHEYILKSGMADRITLLYGDAAEILGRMQDTYDLVFIDADKVNYALYYDLIFDQVKSGGYILADNVLFHGDVLQPDRAGKNAKAMHAFNQKIIQDTRVECVLLPIRDGIMLIRKK
jgi:predicted O-methyltransferase YrrM